MIIIIDFGSQYNQLIARRVRENQVYCQIEAPTTAMDAIRRHAPQGIILSGGPCSIYEAGSPKVAPQARALFDQLCEAGLALDTLSMGMTADLEAAVHAGSTMVRVGTAIFGGRARAAPNG